ncbi:Bacteriophage A118, Gp4, minor capsid [Moorella glycerini]|uniref:Phage minor capsid protein 2 n=1 Tax=Neomoorella stamsii TaxID=1266720 RepID=A0A9X7J025_9FIRM|nr:MULTISPECIES: phage minor capsid protein [Moorella]PRR69605.1 Phage minor capsid protein 2 [Moorella stamsii]CEP67871.1 Bacteriophage A118, Gp4, minor capsid [Moorella glycerini]CEP68741.1 Bacteriophage A118, Gp4, minor capsid [Moorella glycerini]
MPPRGPDERLVRFSEDEVARLVQLYTEAEREILNEINRALLRGNKTEYLQAMLANVQAILEDLRNGSRTWCEEAIPRIYVEGAKFAEEQLKAQREKIIVGFGVIHQQAAQVLAEAAYNRLEGVVQTIGRKSEDIYRVLALENIRGSVIGYKTWEQVAKSYREQLAERGVTGFEDAAGRNWNMRSYTEMVARTTTMEAHLQGTANRLLEHGHDLVKVSTHSGACNKCSPWQGKILSLTGRTRGFPTLQEAKQAGLFHPNCRHAYGLYIDLDEEIERLEKELGS